MPTDYPIGAQPTQAVQPIDLTEVNIRKVSNGFIVNIGCKLFVAKTWQEASKGLELYFKDQNAARQKYCEDEAYLRKEKPSDLSRNRPRKIGGGRKVRR